VHAVRDINPRAMSNRYRQQTGPRLRTGDTVLLKTLAALKSHDRLLRPGSEVAVRVESAPADLIERILRFPDRLSLARQAERRLNRCRGLWPLQLRDRVRCAGRGRLTEMAGALGVDIACLGDRAVGIHVGAALVGVLADRTLRGVVRCVGAPDRLRAELAQRQGLELRRVGGKIAKDPFDPISTPLAQFEIVGLRIGLAGAPRDDQVAATLLDVLPDLRVKAEEEIADGADLAVLVLEDVLANLERTKPCATVVVGIGGHRIDHEVHREEAGLGAATAADGDQCRLLLDCSTGRQPRPEVVDRNQHAGARSVLRRRGRQATEDQLARRIGDERRGHDRSCVAHELSAVRGGPAATLLASVERLPDRPYSGTDPLLDGENDRRYAGDEGNQGAKQAQATCIEQRQELSTRVEGRIGNLVE
jgi:hypothetical protein